MHSPINSNLIDAIDSAVAACFYRGESFVNACNGLLVEARWVDSTRQGYSIVNITISEYGNIKLSYDDYGTECSNDLIKFNIDKTRGMKQ